MLYKCVFRELAVSFREVIVFNTFSFMRKKIFNVVY